MTILSRRLPYLNALGLPGDAEMIRRARAFVLRSGLTLTEFAGIAELNASSLRVFCLVNMASTAQAIQTRWRSARRSNRSLINTRSKILSLIQNATTTQPNSRRCGVRCGPRFATAPRFSWTVRRARKRRTHFAAWPKTVGWDMTRTSPNISSLLYATHLSRNFASAIPGIL